MLVLNELGRMAAAQAQGAGGVHRLQRWDRREVRRRDRSHPRRGRNRSPGARREVPQPARAGPPSAPEWPRGARSGPGDGPATAPAPRVTGEAREARSQVVAVDRREYRNVVNYAEAIVDNAAAVGRTTRKGES